MDAEGITRQVDGRTFQLNPTSRSHYRGRFGTEYDVCETTGGKSRHLNTGVDPLPMEALTDEVLVALASTRRQDLVALMRAYKIVAGCDYPHESAYELLYSTEPVGQYVCVSGDETYHWIKVVDTVEAALNSLAGDVEDQSGTEYPRHPVELRDLDTGHSLPFRIRVVAELDY